MFTTFNVLLILLGLLFILILKQLKKYSVLNKIPGPSTFNAIKSLLFSKSNEEICDYIQSLPKKYGSVVKVWIKPFKPAVLITDKRFIEHVLSSRNYLDKSSAYKLICDIGGNGLPQNQNLLSWKNDRKLIGPLFTRKEVSKHIYKFKKHAEKLKMLIEQEENKVVDVISYTQSLSLEIIIDFLSGQNTLNHSHIIEDNLKSLETFVALLTKRSYSIYKHDFLFKLTKDYKTWKGCCKFIDDFALNVLKNHIKSRESNDKLNSPFLDLLIDSGLSQYEILSHLKTFILAGYETSSRTMAHALFEVAKHPQIQEKILKEYLSVMEENNNEMINFDGLQTMVYTESLIKETLRMYPPVPILQRKLTSPVIIDDIEIPNDVELIFFVLALQRSSEIDRPFEFDPERFLPENIYKIPSFLHIPFSIGPRDCLGKQLAMAEIKFIISYIIRHFTIHPVQPEHKLDLIMEFSLRSKNGVPVILKKRT